MATKKKKVGKRVAKRAPEQAAAPASKQAARVGAEAATASGSSGLPDAELGRRIRGLLNSDSQFRQALQDATMRELLGGGFAVLSRANGKPAEPPRASASPAAAPSAPPVSAPARAARSSSGAESGRRSPAAESSRRSSGADLGRRARMTVEQTQQFDEQVDAAIRAVAGRDGAKRGDVLNHLRLSADDAAKVSQSAKRLEKAGRLDIDSSRGRAATVWRPL